MEEENKKNNLAIPIVISLFLCFPVGLIFMWAKSSWSTKTKVFITSLFAILILIRLFEGVFQEKFKLDDVPEEITIEKGIFISGRAEEGVVTINQKKIPIENKLFSVELPLKLGSNKIIIEYQPNPGSGDEKQSQEFFIKRMTKKRFEAEQKKQELAKLCEQSPEKAIEIKKKSWIMGDWKVTAKHNVLVYNPCPFDVKDIEFRVLYYAESRTLIDSTNRTIYKIIKSRKSKWMKFDGLVNSQVKSSSVKIQNVTALIN